MAVHPEPDEVARKRPQLDVPVERLHLDPANPRLPEEIQGKGEPELLQHLFDHFDLEEIADPMGKNGYFNEEPLVVVPQKLPSELKLKAGEQEARRIPGLHQQKDNRVHGRRGQ